MGRGSFPRARHCRDRPATQVAAKVPEKGSRVTQRRVTMTEPCKVRTSPAGGRQMGVQIRAQWLSPQV